MPRLLRADDVWCQLFSEPASGSDLAALRITAVRDGDDRVVNGQKVWTTLAHVADLGILLARTDPQKPKHAGLTMFLDDVRIPDSERLGEPGEGWRVALTTLMNERVATGGAGSDLGVPVERLVAHAHERLPRLDPDHQVLARQAVGRAVGRAVVASLATRYTGYRRFTELSRGGLPGPEASAGKLAGTAAAKLVADADVRLLGDDAVYAATADGDEIWQRSQGFLPGLAITGGARRRAPRRRRPAGRRRRARVTPTQLRHAVADGVATITLHRPARRNAFTPVMAESSPAPARRPTPTRRCGSCWSPGPGRTSASAPTSVGARRPPATAARGPTPSRAARWTASRGTGAASPPCRSPGCASRSARRSTGPRSASAPR